MYASLTATCTFGRISPLSGRGVFPWKVGCLHVTKIMQGGKDIKIRAQKVNHGGKILWLLWPGIELTSLLLWIQRTTTERPHWLTFTWCGGDVVVYVKDINHLSLPTPFYSVLVFISVFLTLSTVFYSINCHDNSPLCHSVLPVLTLPYWSSQLYIYVWKSPSALI